MAVITLEHPSLGKILGQDGEAVRFLGVPYATLAHRFAEPQLLNNSLTLPLDATRYGPSSPTPPGAFQLEMAMMQQNLVEPEAVTSDVHALNLNITVPYIDGRLVTTAKLPVFVWIHGGGFVSGSPTWPQYDMTNMIKLSAEKGVPVIGVTIGFRLGPLGYLTSQELRNAGCTTNNQLRDQITALEWVQSHIGGFGGDAENVTIAGESTGAVEVGLLLQMDQPLFARAFMSGGSSLLMPPAPPDSQEWMYREVIKAVGLESASVEERVNTLTTMPILELMSKLAMPLPYRPTIDGEIVKYAATYAVVGDRNSSEIASREWLKGLMIGDCQFDASSMAFFLGHKKAGICENFPKYIRQSFPDEPWATKLLEAYGFTSMLKDEDLAFKKFLHFFNDISYYAPTIHFARGWSSNCHVFFINERNPWEGMFKGEATHVMDVMLLFQNLNEQFPPAVQANAVQFAVDCFKFMHGTQPWPSCTAEQQSAKIYGPSSWEPRVSAPIAKVVDDILSPETGRRRVMIDIGARLGFDELARAVARFNAS